jgi:polar amino acid transport system substrate-binding protein
VIKLAPVLRWLVRDRPALAVVAEIPTHERLGIAVALNNAALCAAIDSALAALKQDGTFDTLYRQWFA